MAIGLTVHPPHREELSELTFEQQRVRIGRGAMCDLHVPHRAVSSVHAMIFLESDRYLLVDPGSTNGTTLNGEMLVIERRKLLRSGDVIGVAGFEIVFRAGAAMVSHDFRDRTAAVARQLARHVMLADGGELRSAAFVVLAGPQAGKRFEISPAPCAMSIGRSDDNDIVLDDRDASRRHLELDVAPEGVVARDLGGKNSLLVNDQEVQQHRLKDRDELLVGSTRLVFDEPVEAYLRELAQLPDARIEVQPVDRSAEQSDGDTTHDEAITSSRNSVEEPEEKRSDDGGAEEIEAEVFHDVIEAEDISPLDEGRSPPADSRENVVSRRELGMSASTEIAVLFVGVLALAVSIFALVWIFR